MATKKNQEETLAKLDTLLGQNELIIEENKILKQQNTILMQNNTELILNVKTLEKCVKSLQSDVHIILENAENIKTKTKGIEDKLIQGDQINNILSPQLPHTLHTPTRHSVIISPTNETEISQSTWCDVAKTNITKKLTNVQVNKLGLTKNGKYFVNFPNKQSQEKAIECLKEDFVVKPETKAIGLTPKITVCDLDPQTYTAQNQEQLKDDILLKNPEIQNLVKDGKTFDVLFIQETQQSTNRAVIRVAAEILSHLNNLKETRKTNAILFIQNSACRFYNRFHIVQCYKCQSFGHRKGSPSCPLNLTNRNTCLYCSLNHTSKDCIFKRQPDKFKCANCSRFQDEDDNNQALCHTTTDHSCPIFQKQIEHVLKNTRGIGKCAKNDFAKHVFVT